MPRGVRCFQITIICMCCVTHTLLAIHKIVQVTMNMLPVAVPHSAVTDKLLHVVGWCLPCLSDNEETWHSCITYCDHDVWWLGTQRIVSLLVLSVLLLVFEMCCLKALVRHGANVDCVTIYKTVRRVLSEMLSVLSVTLVYCGKWLDGLGCHLVWS